MWRLFAKYHYLNHSHNKSADVWLLYINYNLAGLCSFLPFPHPKVKNFYTVHRLVILPDYQGLGLGIKFVSELAYYYTTSKDKRVILTTSHPVMIYGLNNHSSWLLTRKGRVSLGSGKMQNKKIKDSTSSNRITTSWEYDK